LMKHCNITSIKLRTARFVWIKTEVCIVGTNRQS
jgi:hypothetical protein